MNATYKNRIAASKARQDSELLAAARMFGHHGIAQFIEVARQRHKTAITQEYATDLLSRAGHPAKP